MANYAPKELSKMQQFIGGKIVPIYKSTSKLLGRDIDEINRNKLAKQGLEMELEQRRLAKESKLNQQRMEDRVEKINSIKEALRHNTLEEIVKSNELNNLIHSPTKHGHYGDPNYLPQIPQDPLYEDPEQLGGRKRTTKKKVVKKTTPKKKIVKKTTPKKKVVKKTTTKKKVVKKTKKV